MPRRERGGETDRFPNSDHRLAEDGSPQSWIAYPHIFRMRLSEHYQEHPEKAEAIDAAMRAGDPAWRPVDSVMARWTSRRLGAMPTEDITRAFALLGMPLDEARFRELAAGHTSVIDLVMGLHPPEEYPEPYDSDFAWIGALELWRRWLGRPCVEMIELDLCDGYIAMDAGDREVAIGHWESVWDLLGRTVPVEVRSLEAAEEHLVDLYPGLLHEWCHDLCHALFDTSYGDRAVAERLLAFCEGMLARFPETDRKLVLMLRTMAANSLAVLGRRGESDAAFGALVGSDPDEGAPYLFWGDSFWRRPTGGGWTSSIDDRRRAREIYEEGLRRGGPLEYAFKERLRELLEHENMGYGRGPGPPRMGRGRGR